MRFLFNLQVIISNLHNAFYFYIMDTVIVRMDYYNILLPYIALKTSLYHVITITYTIFFFQSTTSSEMTGSVIAHEIGHNFGLLHTGK